jgi:hypothetical protein
MSAIMSLVPLAISLWLHWPGHLSYDAINVWFESEQTRLFTQHPPLNALLWYYAALVVDGPALVNALQLTLLWLVAYVVLVRMRPSVIWAVAFLTFLLVFPPIFTRAADLEKDIIGADLAVLAIILVSPSRGAPLSIARISGSAVIATLAMLFRTQLGICLAILLGLLWWFCRRSSSSAKAITCVAALSSVAGTMICVQVLIGLTFQPPARSAMSQSFRKVLFYDIAGVVAADPGTPLAVFAANDIDVVVLKQQIDSGYSPDRLDPLLSTYRQLDRVSDSAILTQWWLTVRGSWTSFLNHRVNAFFRLIGFGDVWACSPAEAGISKEPADRYQAVRPTDFNQLGRPGSLGADIFQRIHHCSDHGFTMSQHSSWLEPSSQASAYPLKLPRWRASACATSCPTSFCLRHAMSDIPIPSCWRQ